MLRRALFAAAALSAPGLALTIASERLIRPRVFNHGPWHPEPPDAIGWPYEEAMIFTPDGLQLQGWFFKQPRPSPTILFFHGTSYNASDMWLTEERQRAFYDFLSRIRANFLLFDYRGFGPNPGTTTELGTYCDGAGALAWLYQREDVDPSSIFFYGFSLGTGVATEMALREPCAGLILRAPFTSIRDMACERHPSLRALLSVAPWLPLTNYDSLSKIRRIECPLLVMHGDSDTTVPERMGQAIFEAAPEPKRYVQLPNSGHSDISADLVVPPITQFIDDVLARRAGAEARETPAAAGG